MSTHIFTIFVSNNDFPPYNITVIGLNHRSTLKLIYLRCKGSNPNFLCQISRARYYTILSIFDRGISYLSFGWKVISVPASIFCACIFLYVIVIHNSILGVRRDTSGSSLRDQDRAASGGCGGKLVAPVAPVAPAGALVAPLVAPLLIYYILLPIIIHLFISHNVIIMFLSSSSVRLYIITTYQLG